MTPQATRVETRSDSSPEAEFATPTAATPMARHQQEVQRQERLEAEKEKKPPLLPKPEVTRERLQEAAQQLRRSTRVMRTPQTLKDFEVWDEQYQERLRKQRENREKAKKERELRKKE